jgi:hypothetical protein
MCFNRDNSRLARIVVVILLCSVIITIPTPGRAAPDHPDALQIFNRDVYVLVGPNLRNPDITTAPDASLYNEFGALLGVTWGQWQAATANSTARAQGGPNHPRTDVRIQLSGLIPGGVYSIFYLTLGPDSENPLCPGVERGLALTAFKPDRQFPDASSFVAGANGQAEYRGQVEGDLFSATQLVFEVIYHLDGQTYHPLPNRGEFLTQGSNCRSSFGQDAMRQLLIFQKY